MDVYLDNAASTIITKEVLDEMIKCQKDIFANPSSAHKFGRKAKTIIENCRSIISSKLKTSPGNIFFTSGGTEGDNMAIFSIARSEKIKNIITSRIEHPAVLQPIEYLMKNEKIISHFVDTDKNGNIDYQHLSSLLSKFESNTLVSLMHANNEIGIINDIKKIGEICKKNNAFFHSDAVQTVCHYEIDLSNSETLKIDFVLGQIETNVTSIILISLIMGYFLANLNRLLSSFNNLFCRNKKNQAQEIEKIEDFRKVFAESHDNKNFQNTKNNIGS